MIQVKRAEYQSNYRIWVEFTDGARGVADLEDFLWGPVFEPLRDLEKFKRFRITEGYRTIAWGEDADIAPEALYDRAVRKAA